MAQISKVEVVDSKVVVTYESGSKRSYSNDSLPKTVSKWIDENKDEVKKSRIKVNVDGFYTVKKFETALNRFMRENPGLEEWREGYEYLHESGEDRLDDTRMADGTYNKDWRYSLNLDEQEDGYYLSYTEREKKTEYPIEDDTETGLIEVEDTVEDDTETGLIEAGDTVEDSKRTYESDGELIADLKKSGKELAKHAVGVVYYSSKLIKAMARLAVHLIVSMIAVMYVIWESEGDTKKAHVYQTAVTAQKIMIMIIVELLKANGQYVYGGNNLWRVRG